nr:MAG TPA: hypothetical protein [Caudoviricetes sp.]
MRYVGNHPTGKGRLLRHRLRQIAVGQRDKLGE